MIRILIVLILIQSVQAVRLSEVMYDPMGSDYDLEWFEVYATDFELNKSVNVQIGLNSFNITPMTNYYVVVREYYDTDDLDNLSFFNQYGAVIAEEQTFSLPNKLTKIKINNISYTYDLEFGARGDGRSLVFDKEVLPSKTIGGTPGKVNDVENYNFTINFLNQNYYLDKYTSFFEIKNNVEKSNVSFNYLIKKDDSILKQESIVFEINKRKTARTGTFEFTESGNYSICAQIEDNLVCEDFLVIDQRSVACDVNLGLDLPLSVTDINKKIEYKFLVDNKTFPFKIEYEMRDLFNKKVRSKKTTTSLSKKSFTPKFEGLEKSYVLNATLIPTCNDTNLGNNRIQRVIGARGKILKNSLKIDSAQFDNQSCSVKVKVLASKADAKKVIHLRAKDEKTIGEAKADLLSKGEHSLRFNMPLKYCPEDDLTLTLSGLGQVDELIIPINVSKNEKLPLTFEIIQKPQVVLENEIFKVRVKVTNPTDEYYKIKSLAKLSRSNESQELDLHIANNSSIEFDLKFKAKPQTHVMVDNFVNNRKTPIKLRESIQVVSLNKTAFQEQSLRKIPLNKQKTPIKKIALTGSVISFLLIFGQLILGKSI